MSIGLILKRHRGWILISCSVLLVMFVLVLMYPAKNKTRWNELLGMDIVQAVETIQRDRPDLYIHVLEPGEMLFTKRNNRVRVVVDSSHRVVAVPQCG